MRDVALGSPAFFEGRRIPVPESVEEAIARLPATGETPLLMAIDGKPAGLFGLKETLRPESRGALQDLKALGIRGFALLTGDRLPAAEATARALGGFDHVAAEQRPEDKAQWIESLHQSGRRVAMIGDGVNDAPSLAVADVGVAMGARGSDAALEQAEVVLMHDRLENFLTAFQLSRKARRVIQQNLVISLGTVAVLVVCALFGKIPLTLGVLGHEGSTVIVVMNSLRLLLARG